MEKLVVQGLTDGHERRTDFRGRLDFRPARIVPGERRRTATLGASDWLFPEGEVRAPARRIRSAGVSCRYEALASSHGHDGFLADADSLAPLLCEALSEQHGRAAQHAA